LVVLFVHRGRARDSIIRISSVFVIIVAVVGENGAGAFVFRRRKIRSRETKRRRK